MRTYRLVIAYDGTAYQGWQRQANTEMTIQGILESCISKAAGYAVEVNGSGRTDAGVHARGQTASVVLHGKAEDGFFTETTRDRQLDEELADVLIAISVIAKRLARKLQTANQEGGTPDGENERPGLTD